MLLKSSIAAACLVACILGVVLIVVPAMKRSSESMLHDALVAAPLKRVTDGANGVSVTDRLLLAELAADVTCIRNLTEIVFTSTTLNVGDQEPLKKLVNITTLGFYCCDNVDSIVPAIVDMHLDVLWFETSQFSADTLKIIGDSHCTKEIVFEQNLTEAHVGALKSFPATIKITSSFPLDAFD